MGRGVVKTAAIVNPRSGGGRTGARLGAIGDALAAALGEVTVLTTTAPGDATRLTAKALREGYRRIVAIGGDGTLNEAVNGFFSARAPIAADAEFAFAMSGSGGDFRKSFDIGADLMDAIARLKSATPRPIDLGRVAYRDRSGAAQERLFLNIASCGLSGDVVERVNRARIAKWFGGPFAFKWHSTMAALGFKPWRLRLTVDEAFDRELDVSVIAVCNGRYFGGGMKVAPDAALDDGLFDIVVIGATSKREMIARMNEIYAGAHIAHPSVTVLRGRHVVASVVDERPAPAERDGEGDMRLPATFDILPAALTVLI